MKIVIKFNFFILMMLALNINIKAQDNNRSKPNIIIIYTDDLGFGDISCNGTSRVQTPNIDKLAKSGVNFKNVHATSATCTPSRYSLLTGEYAWKKEGTGIASGNAALILPTDQPTLPGLLQKYGYRTGVIGKWHLGLGNSKSPNWNAEIHPGPAETGFDYSFIMPATADRVPCVFMENSKVVNLNPSDPIEVSYFKNFAGEPTGKDNPELLKMMFSHDHDGSIVDSVSRIGFMKGGKSALWVDEEIAGVFVNKANDFLVKNKNNPFFLYLSTHDIHVPRLPNSRFAGKSGLGPRGDAIIQLDWTVGEILNKLDSLNLRKNTLIVFSSDNGAVLDDGYRDKSVTLNGSHRAEGIYKGGKYSAFEGGTRIPFIVSWPAGNVKSDKISEARFSQIDIYASIASLVNADIPNGAAVDSEDNLNVLLGKSKKDRPYILEQSLNNNISVVHGKWKFIPAHGGPEYLVVKGIPTGNSSIPQLYDLSKDPGEVHNLADLNMALVDEFQNYINNNVTPVKK